MRFKEYDLVMLHRRIDDLETNLKGRISNIVVELSAISDQHNTEPSREYNTLLVKQNEHLTNENLKLKQENELLKDRVNVMALAVSDLQKRIEDTENEKLSLVTAFKIVHDQHKDVVGNSSHCSNNGRLFEEGRPMTRFQATGDVLVHEESGLLESQAQSTSQLTSDVLVPDETASVELQSIETVLT